MTPKLPHPYPHIHTPRCSTAAEDAVAEGRRGDAESVQQPAEKLQNGAAEISYRVALAVAKYLCRHLSVGMYRLVDDLLRDSSLLPAFAEVGAVEVVGGVPVAPRPGTAEWWRAYAAVRDAVLYLEARGVVKYLPKLEVVNWIAKPCSSPTPPPTSPPPESSTPNKDGVAEDCSKTAEKSACAVAETCRRRAERRGEEEDACGVPMSALSLRGLHAFADLYVGGRLAEEFTRQYGVKPCREYGVPERVGFICEGGELVELIFRAEKGKLSKKKEGKANHVFLSMALVDWRLYDDPQSYVAFDRVCIDLDIPGDCAQDRLCRAAKLGRLKAALREKLRKYKDALWAEWTGFKGYRLCVWLPRLLPADRIILEKIQRWLAKGLDEWLDTQVVGDVKRLFRVPYSINPKSGERAAVVDHMLQSLSPQEAAEHLQSLKPLDARVLERIRRETALETFAKELERAREVKAPKGVRQDVRRLPRWVEALVEHLQQTGELCHAARVALARWLYFVGYSRDEIIEVFRAAADFNEKKTVYHVDYEIRRMGEECRAWQPDKCKEKPWRCATVIEKCGGEKVPPNLQELCPVARDGRPAV